MNAPRIITRQNLADLSRQADDSERLRKNLNLHEDYEDPCQRLFNAVEPATYIRPHRHTTPPKPECFLALMGLMALVLFDDQGTITEIVPFGAGTEVVAVDLPAGCWHAIVSLESGSVFFETKPGPYAPVSDKDFAPWAPAEGSSAARDYHAALVAAVERHLADR